MIWNNGIKIARTIMFDPKNPNNKLPILPPKFDFDDIDILKVNKANIALSTLNGCSLQYFNEVFK